MKTSHFCTTVFISLAALTGFASEEQVLQNAFDGASKMPLNPHVKNRSRAQLQLVNAALAVKRADLARSYADEIVNWQKLVAYAQIAECWIDNREAVKAEGLVSEIEKFCLLAKEYHSEDLLVKPADPLLESLADWRLEKVHALLIGLKYKLGKTVSEKDFGLTDEIGLAQIQSAQVSACADQPFEQTFKELSFLALNPNIEIAKIGLFELSDLFDSHYSNKEQQEKILHVVDTAITNLPVVWRFDVKIKFADTHIENEQYSSALEILNELNAMVDSIDLQPRFLIPYKTALAERFFKAGQQETARAAVLEMENLYDEKRDFIVNIDRAALLCRLAESRLALGDKQEADALWIRAVKEGVINPNSRPRVDALCEISSSIVAHNAAPSEDLIFQLNKMNSDLGRPW